MNWRRSVHSASDWMVSREDNCKVWLCCTQSSRNGPVSFSRILEKLTGPFLLLWVQHSQTLQLSSLETIQSEAEWTDLRQFIKRYGGDLFHARFLTLANLRGVLHRGAGAYLDYVRDNPDPLRPVKLLDDLGRSLPREDAVRRLEVALQA